MRMTGTSTFSGTFSSNSGNINAYDTGVPALTGSPAFRFDTNTGNTGSATYSSSCTSTSFSDCGATCSGILPVELLSFTVRNECAVNRIEWSTATETNCDYFLVERSGNGVSYEQARMVKGAGNSSQINNYTVLDESFIAENTIYYRLKQVDFDGKFEYFSPVAERIHCGNVFFVFPSVTNGQVRIRSSGSQAGALITVTDITGRRVLAVAAGDGWKEKMIDLSGNASGVYFISVSGPEETVVKKIILM
jgi:hypothetical protein